MFSMIVYFFLITCIFFVFLYVIIGMLFMFTDRKDYVLYFFPVVISIIISIYVFNNGLYDVKVIRGFIYKVDSAKNNYGVLTVVDKNFDKHEICFDIKNWQKYNASVDKNFDFIIKYFYIPKGKIANTGCTSELIVTK